MNLKGSGKTPKQYIVVYYRIFISAVVGEIRYLDLKSWIFVDMHDMSQLGSRNFFSYDTMINLLHLPHTW